jgi:DUF2934 family protein
MATRANRKTSNEQSPIEQVSKANVSDEQVLRQRIAEKAYELYERWGCCHGRDLDDWLEAEQLVLIEIAGRDQKQ